MTAYQLYQSVNYAETHEIPVSARIVVVGGSETEEECNKMCYGKCEKKDVKISYTLDDSNGFGLPVTNTFELKYKCPTGALRNNLTPPFRWWILVSSYLGAELFFVYLGVPIFLYYQKRKTDSHNSPEYLAYMKK